VAYADQLARIMTHVTTASNAVVPAIDDVQNAFPVPRGRCVRVFWTAEEDPTVMPESVLNADLIAEATHVSVFWPISNISETDAADYATQVYAFKHALRTAIDGDTKLNSQAHHVTMRNAELTYAQIAGGEYLVLDVDIVPEATTYTLA
jgi:hypothetical protein